jgi:tetratricopeptide (TPR) repeat protein
MDLWRLLSDDAEAAAGFRIDAAFDLAGVYAGRGQFAESMLPINTLMPLIREEALRTALALTTLAQAEFELGHTERAAVLFDEAVAESAGPATRYLFARGMFELRSGDLDAVARTVAKIQRLAESADDPDRNEDKAASYLAGLIALQQNDLATAADRLQTTLDMQGYQYAVYELGMAESIRASGDLDEALAMATEAESARDPGDFRLDLELDRARAILLRAEILAEQGNVAGAQQQARRFIDLWQNAAQDLPDLSRANALARNPS